MVTAYSPSYKQLKGEFVSNLFGGPTLSIAPTAMLLWSALQSRQSFFRDSTVLFLLVDFLINVCAVPLLLAITLCSSTPLLLGGLIVSLAIFVYVLPQKLPKEKPILQSSSIAENEKDIVIREQVRNGSSALDVLSSKPFLTQYRGSMLLVTCLGILAVHFRLFPRQFAKVET
jgi:phosphatidylinositol glycan class W